MDVVKQQEQRELFSPGTTAASLSMHAVCPSKAFVMSVILSVVVKADTVCFWMTSGFPIGPVAPFC